MVTIFHLDLDSFFVSVERILNPKLEGKPVIVGADPKKGRGVVATCSYEARKYGLHSAMPIARAYKLCPQGIYVHGRHREYSKYSKAVRTILEQYAPIIEQASIDEFYMDFSGTKKLYASMYLLGLNLQSEIYEKLHLPCSIGIGSNKTIAKICSDYAKPKGVTYVINGMEKEFLAPLPVETIPGVGKATLRKLNANGIFKIGHLADLSESFLISLLGKYGTSLWKKANGMGKTSISINRQRKSISKERTYLEDESDRKIIEGTIFQLTGKVCQSLRNKKWLASTIGIKLRYSNFTTLTRAITIKPTDDDKIVFNKTKKLFYKADNKKMSIRLVGIYLTNFDKTANQVELFEDENKRRKEMFNAVTKIRDKYGYSSIQFGKNKAK
ncbi:MAG: DNA polymerase IV [Ignavibacteriae bacterium]|nr:MAG: DNA polymerase IV [Ignavibacteriota bacterium]